MRQYEPGDTVVLEYHDGPRAYVLGDEEVAVILDTADGSTPYDVAANWETAESMILEGHVAVPIGRRNRERYGDMFAAWRKQFCDCWGV
jgi:hypothetical protein